MVYKGTIIEESLNDRHVLKQLKIVGTKVEVVTDKHKTPWLRQWTLHTIEIQDKGADTIALLLSKSIDTSHTSS